MLRKSFLTLALAAFALTTFATTSTAVADTEEAVEYRQGVFKVVRWHFGPMGAMVQGEMDYDAELFARNAKHVAALAPMAIAGFEGFEGSDGGFSDAKAAIWAEWDTFAEGMENFVEESAKLAEVARSGDMGDIRPQFRNVALTCRGCHDDYRKD